ncbi:threonine ammonia-lyase [Dyadobacter fermentans]|uniref:Pyridoxal-5'-phosphate-dependent protein beta subunit n=1 Tax=Dyadobacter fermentans (strain ATCC 700827 / DSM 18053 / CIP 107007 / KCTC 52180 / NS114) TaxID=471854 RepID=C6W0I8_DYAFD|nr:threonine/serine dehydratase [Dyadobacter fermentans]ACT93594.1 Pyridoxal-5'-phosphate-dependent protein beta subunit [Dyadobacter fermentans DSM 18053]
MPETVPTRETIEAAHERVKPYIHQTPVFTSQFLNGLSGARLYFKCENFQKIGAFKARGGLNAVLSLSAAQLANGVITHSSGNHAQAIAFSARKTGTKCYIVMPDNSPKVKIAAVEGYGADITFCKNTPEDRQRTVDEIVARTGATFLHPFNNYEVVAGQATAAKELIADAGAKLDAIVAPVGGGGLLSGTALAARYFSPGTKVYAGEPEGAADAVLSFRSGKIEKASYVNTIADGLLTHLGDKTFPIIKSEVTDIFTVSDEEIIQAMRYLWERMKMVVEPSGAVSTAAVLKNRAVFEGKNVGIIISGGNVDMGRLPF